jgi:hypothetical protein
MEFQKISKTSFHRWIEVVMYKHNQKSRIQFQQYLSYIVAVNFIGKGNQCTRDGQFIGGGKRSSRRKLPTCRNSLKNFIT